MWLLGASRGRVLTHTGKMGEVFPVREKSGNFKILPKSRGILYESGKSQGKLDQKMKKIFYEESLKSIVSRHIFIEDYFHIMKNMFIISEYWGHS